jgi:hypothetical protein
VDQLSRSQALPASQINDLQKAIDSAEAAHMNRSSKGKLKKMVPELEKSADSAKTPADATRMHALADVLKHPSA